MTVRWSGRCPDLRVYVDMEIYIGFQAEIPFFFRCTL